MSTLPHKPRAPQIVPASRRPVETAGVRPAVCRRCDTTLAPEFDAATFTWTCPCCASTWCAEPMEPPA
jgi:hypothetical protein